MAIKFLQDMVYQLRSAFGTPVGMIDESGIIISYDNTIEIEKHLDEIMHLCAENHRPVTFMGYTFLGYTQRGKLEFIAFTKGEDEQAKKNCEILAVSIGGIKQCYDDKYDKTNFIKNVILDNILPGDVLIKSKELHLPFEQYRVCLLTRTEQKGDNNAYEIIQNLFPDKGKDFVINIDENNVVLIKEVKENISPEELEKIAQNIVDTLNAEAMIKVNVGIGSVVENIRDLARSYKEAQVSLEVGKVFDTEKVIIRYGNLGIARLIYQLPTTLCNLFLKEVFQKESLDSLDQETIYTIQKFFENNLNVSETSRQLYVHRNTLVYRLDKVQKQTGLDLRIFDHAIVFKVAMMVKKYLESNPIKM
ncbi:MAG: PucR family transcriptional regulator [Clostridiaceae bacterium]|nr:PucR family transcriptional regulator [Clostridiaceae bacterium]